MVFWSGQSKTKQIKHRANREKPKVSAFHCVEIKSHAVDCDACDAAMQLQGKRFLSAEAPSLPLPECNQKCHCYFKHHNDRRHDDRRDAFSANGIHYDGTKNRRLGSDRRRGDAVYSSLNY